MTTLDPEFKPHKPALSRRNHPPTPRPRPAQLQASDHRVQRNHTCSRPGPDPNPTTHGRSPRQTHRSARNKPSLGIRVSACSAPQAMPPIPGDPGDSLATMLDRASEPRAFATTIASRRCSQPCRALRRRTPAVACSTAIDHGCATEVLSTAAARASASRAAGTFSERRSRSRSARRTASRWLQLTCEATGDGIGRGRTADGCCELIPSLRRSASGSYAGPPRSVRPIRTRQTCGPCWR
jgi:hypothetical protein